MTTSISASSSPSRHRYEADSATSAASKNPSPRRQVGDTSSVEEVVEPSRVRADPELSDEQCRVPITEIPAPEPLRSRPSLSSIDPSRFTPATVSSTLRPWDLIRIRSTYHIPTEIDLILPPADWRAHQPPVSFFTLYEEHLVAGLRFPLHKFIVDVLRYYRIPLAQLVPNGVRILIRFLITCLEHNVPPTVTLFRYFFQMRRSSQTVGYRSFHSRTPLKILTPENNQGWKPRFFFVRVQGWDLPEEWNFDRFADPFAKHKTYSTPSTVVLGALSSLDGRRVTDTELIRHGLNAAFAGEKGKQSSKGL